VSLRRGINAFSGKVLTEILGHHRVITSTVRPRLIANNTTALPPCAA
jgi:hypothetical protein